MRPLSNIIFYKYNTLQYECQCALATYLVNVSRKKEAT